MGKTLIIYSNVPVFKKWPTNFKLLFQAPQPRGYTKPTQTQLQSHVGEQL